jgi:hypothetical protein
MNRFGLCAGLATAWLAGCASAPLAEGPQAQLGFTTAAGDESAISAAAPERGGDEVVIQGEVDAQNVHPGSQVVCKDMLQHASNVIRTRCMTVDAWKRYETAEAQRAQAILRAWQGSPYAGF